MTGRYAKETGGRGGAALGAERQREILALIDRGGIVSVGAFSERFGVSQETIRRDIRSLEEAGQLRRVHGGAAPMRTFDLTARRPVAERLGVDREAKQQAARAAMSLFANDMNVFLGASSTMLLVAEELARSEKSLTITTNMIDIANVLAADGRSSVTLLGGVVDPHTHTVTGVEVFKSLETRLFDLCVLGASAISATHGVLGPAMTHSVLATTVRERARVCAIVADHAKFDRRDAQIVLALAQVDFLATDLAPPEETREALERAGVEVLLPQEKP